MNFLDDIYETTAKLLFCFKNDFPARFALCEFDIRDIPKSTFFPHPVGIVIRSGTRIGENCIIRQNVTIGIRKDEINERPAKIGDNVIIGANAVILGSVTIGNNVVIGAGSIVLINIPENRVYISKILSDETVMMKNDVFGKS